MKKIYILCVDDEPEVLEAVERDIAELEDDFPLETAESADDARTVIDQIYAVGDRLGLILCDHVMPGDTGVELLIEMFNDERTHDTRRVLLTGQAGLEATVQAVNAGQLNHYIAKPWTPDNLRQVARDQLTEYVIQTETDPRPYMQQLNMQKLAEVVYKRGLISDE